MLNIEELDKKFDELLKDFDEEYINGWIKKKIEEEKEEQRKKRSEQLPTLKHISKLEIGETIFEDEKIKIKKR